MKNIIEAIAKTADESDNLICVTDKEGKIVWVNQAFTLTSGYTFEEAIGQNPRILKSGMYGETFYKELWDVIKSNKKWKGIIFNKRKDGTVYRAMTTISPVKDSVNGDEIIGYVSSEQDMSLHDSLNEEIILSEKKLLMAFDVAEVAMFLLTAEGKFLQVNRAACEILGYSQEELLGKTFYDITHPDDRAKSAEILAKMYAEKDCERYVLEKRYIKKNGDVLIGKMGCVIARDLSGEPIFLISQIQDLTKLKRLETESQGYVSSINAANRIFKVVSEISEFTINQEIFNLDDVLRIAGEKLEMDFVFVQSCNHELDLYKEWSSKNGKEIKPNFEIVQMKKPELQEWVSEGISFLGKFRDAPKSIYDISSFLGVETHKEVFAIPVIIRQRPWGLIGFVNGNGHPWSEAEQEALNSLGRLIAVMIEGNWEKNKLLEHISFKFDEIETFMDKQENAFIGEVKQ